jgi:hypoxanthine phosphoribosyltransferase
MIIKIVTISSGGGAQGCGNVYVRPYSHIDIPLQIDFMAVSSYGSSTESSGVVRILKDLDETVEGKDLLVVEDIIDSGLTLSYMCNILQSRKPASLKICALLDKPSRRKVDLNVDYLGFRDS